MKQNSVFDKFQKFWEELNEEERGNLWDVMTALRGPDFENGAVSDMLKALTTARVRALFIPKNSRSGVGGYWIFDSLKAVNDHFKQWEHRYMQISSVRDAKDLLYSQEARHFKAHFSNALFALSGKYKAKTEAIAKVVGLHI